MRGFGAVVPPTAAEIRTVQQQINTALVANGYESIKVDGILGPKTCGAARATQHPALAEMGCTKFTDPVRAAGGPPIPPAGPKGPASTSPFPEPAAPLAPAPAAAGMFGFDMKTILIGAGVIGVGVVVVYALKKKSQAA
jgi:hypothetical protein